MVEFSVEVLKGTVNTFGVSLICPHCRYRFAFFYKCPLYCGQCGEELPNIASLMEMVNDKLIYHETGKTKCIDRTLYARRIEI